MRLGFVLLALVAAAAAVPSGHHRAADHDLLKKQQDTIYLLDRIGGHLPNHELHNYGQSYDIIANAQNYEEPAIVYYYGGMVKHGHIQPKGTVYSNSVSQLRKEVALLTRILLGAKDYEVFLKTAAWARVHVNEEQFVKAYIAALLQREDTQGVIPPPLYEILPRHYVDARVIQEAQNIIVKGGEGLGEVVVIPVNYTDYYPHGENHLSYFTDDIGLNAYYAYISLAGFMIPEHLHQKTGYKQGRDQYEGHHIGHGAYYYYLHQQLLAHYNLERLSNGLGPIEDVDFEHVQAPYKAHLRTINGLEYPSRPDDLYFRRHHDLVKNVYLLEKRLLNAIDSGYVITPQQEFLSLYQPQGLNILGDLIEGTGRSVNPRYYGSLQAVARQLLGNTPDFVNIWSYTPSALELSESAVRDPAFYQLYKRVIKLFRRYQQSLPAYQYNDVVLEGVRIEKVDFPNLVTYFDEHLINIGNGIVHPAGKEQDIKIKAALNRLNHKQYEYQIHVEAEKAYSNAVVRVYLGPKFDHEGLPIDINHHRHHFVELDQFVHNLKQGKNVIVRNSHESPIHSADYPSVQQIKVHVDSAVRSQNPFYITEPQQIFGFPARLSVPKGTRGGFPLQVLVVISSSDVQEVPYGPVVPPQYQTYQHHLYQVVNHEQYDQYVQQGQQPQKGVLQGGYQTVEVVPHYEGHGIYGNELNKYQAYYGHYLYMKYPSQFPIYYQHYYGHGQERHGSGHEHRQYENYGHGVGGQQQYGYQQHQGTGHQHQGDYVQGQEHQGVHGYQHQSHYGQHGGQGQYQGQYQQTQGYHGVPIGQQTYQGTQGGQHEKYQGTQGGQYYQGTQGVQGHQYQKYQQGGVETEIPQHGYQGGVQGGQGVHTGVHTGTHTGVHTGTHTGVHTGTHTGGHSGVHTGAHTGVEGGHGIFHHQNEQSAYLKDYYQGKHISHIIGGAVSFDGKPLGYPLNRPLAPSVLYVPNIMVTDVVVYHEHSHHGVH